MTSSLLLIDISLVNLTIFKLAASCPCLEINPFTDTTSVDNFLTNNTSIFTTTLINIGCLNIFTSKSVLDYFERQITLLYPTISHIDILDKNSMTLQHDDIKVIENGVATLALEGPVLALADPVLALAGPVLALAGPALALADPALALAGPANPVSSSKINFRNFNVGNKNNQSYFSTPLRILFHYVPLVFPTTKTNCTNLMLIDSTISESQVFYAAANTSTLPVLFNSNTLRSEIIQLLTHHTTINRLCVVATNRSMYNNTKLFINNETYFTLEDLTTPKSNNVQFMIDLIQSHNIKTIDFLACESLTYNAWKNYYLLLQGHGCAVGASSDKTGNLAYGGNWIMESDNQNIQPVYFTEEIADYTTTLDSILVNILFGNYSPGEGIPAISPVTLPPPVDGTTYAIYNSTANPVTVHLAPATELVTYNVEINVVPGGYPGNGSKVTIDGSGVAIVPSDDLFNGTSLVTVVDETGALTDIIIQNIDVDVSVNPSLTGVVTTGWILKGGLLNESNIDIDNCSVHSSGTLTIGGGGYYNGGIGGGGNYNNTTLTFTSCSVYSSGDLTIGGGGYYNGGIGGGDNINTSLTFTSCSVHSSGTLTIGGGGYYNGGIGGGGNYNNTTLTFTSCSVYSSGSLSIGGDNSNYNGGICGGDNSENTTLTFTSCSVYSSGSLSIGSDNSNRNGGICGGGIGAAILTFTSCSVYSNGSLSIGDNSNYNGGICGGGGDFGGSNTLTFTSCSVYSSGDIMSSVVLTIGGGNYNGGIGGGGNFNNSTLTFTSCYVYSSFGILTIGGGGYYNGGIGGGRNYNNTTLTFTSCSVYSSGDLTIDSNSCGGISSGDNSENTTLTFTSCSVYSSNGNLTIGGGGNYIGGIAGGLNDNTTLTITSCSVYSSGDLTIGGGGYYNGGIGGGINTNTSLTFTSCSVYSSGILTIGDSSYYDGGIGGGGLNINGTTLTFTTCTIYSTTSVVVGSITYIDGSYNYISDTEDDSTTPPTIVDNGLIYGGGAPILIYPISSLLLVSAPSTIINYFPSNTGPGLNTTFVGQNLTGMDLTQIDFSYYDLSGTILPGQSLPYDTETNKYTNALITDGAAIATNIVINSSISPAGSFIFNTELMTAAGMIALVNGTNVNLNGALSLFVSSLYTAALQHYQHEIEAIFVPASTLFSVNPWLNPISPTSLVQLINASVYPNINNEDYGVPTTSVNLASLNFNNAPYYYILVQNYPDRVTIVNGNNTLLFYANLPVNPVLNAVTFSYSINGGTSSTVIVGNSINFDNYSFYVGSLGFLLQQNPISNICFPAGTPIKTDQGNVHIDKIDTTYHTINNQPIEHVTQTITNDTYLICFEKNALGTNYPSRKTVMSKDHKIYYRRKMVPANHFLTLSNGVRKVKYSGELLYNVLLSKPSTMYVNNILCETLDPENIIAKLYKSKYSQTYKQNIVYLLNESFRKKDLYAYKNIVNRLT